ncbi:shikimate kinase [Verrucomicrobiota bacterium]
MTGSNIVLVGFMGTGKSAVGQRLAQALHRAFVDMDALIESRAGKPIPRIFREDGESHFRDIERAVVRELAKKREQVIAAGGGVVLDQGNIREFSRSGLVVCLSASQEELVRRLSGSTDRPLLKKGDHAGGISDLLKKRQPFYDAIPAQVDTTGLTVEEVVSRILVML